ncbi:Crp/Fnr family transcriptional regulator [Epilithonimonas hungarica]|uniref:cAMP-binding domain of CRP or a regulatory subunit of cAMP-dependent protein kinases n=1 Tax=Epilithonimonas hungarica TaxID=454006 RepID=A0A1G7RTX1_9FLAO|nr:Crp/Fnr family transcriptional regulator [Epilithonimonas hungarica]SDG13290.1 cAMP-binding domain of CRP or a regulatory subunit of cAMP-dependent protein kinases [Epilithonimonas hungarica]
MSEILKNYFHKVLPDFTDEKFNFILYKSQLIKLQRKEIVCKQGDVCNLKIFVAKGLLRTYSTSEDGNEHILQFVNEMSWTTDPESFYNSTPSKLNIEAMEASEIFTFNLEDFAELREQIPELNIFVENILTRKSMEIHRRLLMNISSSPEEKYLDFINTYPDIFNRVPLHMVASYLGLSRETLSRVRRNILKTVL